jgi:hypothetical protein
MGTNRSELARGIKYELGALPLLVLGPVLITMGFKAVKQHNNYLILILGILIALIAMLLIFKGIRIILNAFFNSN